MLPDSIDKSTELFIKERFMVNAKTKKTVKSSGSSPKRKSSKQKPSVKKTTSKKRQQNVKNTSKKTTSKKVTTKVAAQKKSSKKSSNNGVYKAKNTLKVRRTSVNELKKVESVIERLSQGSEPSVQKTAPIVRSTVPGVLRIVHDAQGTVPSTPKTIPIVEAGSFLKKCVKQYWASA